MQARLYQLLSRTDALMSSSLIQPPSLDRVRTAPMALQINVATSEIISPSEAIDDATIAEWERKHLDAVAKSRAQNDEAPEG